MPTAAAKLAINAMLESKTLFKMYTAIFTNAAVHCTETTSPQTNGSSTMTFAYGGDVSSNKVFFSTREIAYVFFNPGKSICMF